MEKARPQRRVAWSALVLCLFLLPLFAVLVPWADQLWDRRVAETAAENDLSASVPQKRAWGVLGEIRLEQGRLNEALPLLRKASWIEARDGDDTRDTLALVQADLEGSAHGLPGAGRGEAEAMLLRAQGIAERLPTGKRAATWFSAGVFWQSLGRPQNAVLALTKAVALQRDDWVDQGGGVRVKSAGLSAYYQKMLAGALQH
jgi:tetratricopeptide (TPR) repeat protein